MNNLLVKCRVCGNKIFKHGPFCRRCGSLILRSTFPAGYYAVLESDTPFNPVKIYTSTELYKAVESEVSIGSIVENEKSVLFRVCKNKADNRLYLLDMEVER